MRSESRVVGFRPVLRASRPDPGLLLRATRGARGWEWGRGVGVGRCDLVEGRVGMRGLRAVGAGVERRTWALLRALVCAAGRSGIPGTPCAGARRPSQTEGKERDTGE